MNIKKDIQNAAKDLKLKAEARSVNIEGKVRENLGDYSDDQKAVEDGQEMQAEADDLRTQADNK
ncbi:MAG: hypothetical protein RLZZ535_2373 [Cyanobacteriota bacterium]|jgi:uncharacterized protein YjbJ (UPF0337 family)